MREGDIQALIRMAIARLSGVIAFRHNVGTGWVGKSLQKPNGDVLVVNARPLHAGLVKGAGDLIGWRTIEITPDMVGKKIAVFLSVEVKNETGRVKPEQKIWLENVNRAGGIAIVARSPEDAVTQIEDFYK